MPTTPEGTSMRAPVHLDSSPEWGSMADYGNRYGLSESTVRRMIATGELAARRFGRQIRLNLNQDGRPVT